MKACKNWFNMWKIKVFFFYHFNILEQNWVRVSQCATSGLAIKHNMAKTKLSFSFELCSFLVTGEINTTICHSPAEPVFCSFGHFKFSPRLCFLHYTPFSDNPPLESKLPWNSTARFIFWYLLTPTCYQHSSHT